MVASQTRAPRLPERSYRPPRPTFDQLVERSAAVPYDLPEGPRNRLVHVATDAVGHAEVVRFAHTTRPIVHARVLPLLDELLAHKRRRGSAVERALYAGLDEVRLLDRLLQRRPLVFMAASDCWILPTGEQGVGGWDEVGTEAEKPPLTLERMLSYDELQLSALLGVSVPTRFINRGGRQNRGRPGEPGTFEETGVYVGLVGARFERPGRMEYPHVLVTPDREEQDPELLRLWARFYGLPDGFPSYTDVAADRVAGGGERFLRLGGGRGYLDAEVYRQRMRLSIEPFLLDAVARAAEDGRRAYVHAVGLGLGVWGIDDRQGQLLCDVFAGVVADHEAIRQHISDLDFSWFPDGCHLDGRGDGDRVDGVRVHFSRRDPAARIEQDRLLVAMYAWDGNAYPGNEYWQGSLSASGDPAAACCSLIPELQNPDINPAVTGANTHTYPR